MISLNGPASLRIIQFSVYNDQGATASDNVDGNLDSSIVTVNPVTPNIPGTYFVTYNVKDNAGNPAAQVTRTVIVEPVTIA